MVTHTMENVTGKRPAEFPSIMSRSRCCRRKRRRRFTAFSTFEGARRSFLRNPQILLRLARWCPRSTSSGQQIPPHSRHKKSSDPEFWRLQREEFEQKRRSPPPHKEFSLPGFYSAHA